MKHLIYLIIICSLTQHSIFGQCTEPDASIWLNTWTSCETKMNPISEYGENHWIQYDFGSVRKLSKSWIWNTNDPARLDQGFNLVKIDYSIDGEEWVNWGDMEFPKAAGKAIYGGFPGPDMVGIEARYVLITAMTNHGHATCCGLAEVKFNLLPQTPEGVTSVCNGENAFDLIEVDFITESEALIYWDTPLEEIPGFLFLYRIADEENEEEDWIEIETEEFEVYLEDLEPGTEYEYLIATECGEKPVFTDVMTFTTLETQVTSTEDSQISLDKLRLYPNPTHSQFTLWYSSKMGGELNYSITNTQGQLLIQNNQGINPGVNKIMVNLAEVPNGMYIIETMNVDQKIGLREKIIKLQEN